MSTGSQQPVGEFLAEAEDLLGSLSQKFSALAEGIGDGGVSPDLLNGIFRDAHSIKGLAGMFGFDDIAELSHHLESLLDHLRLGKLSLNTVLMDCLFDALSDLIGLVEGKGVNPDRTHDISASVAAIQKLLNSKSDDFFDPLAGLDIDPELLNVLTEYEEHRLQENLNRGHYLLLVKAVFSIDSFDVDLAALTESLKGLGEVISTLPGVNNNRPDCLAFQLLCGTPDSGSEVFEKLGNEAFQVEVISGLPSVAEENEEEDSSLATGQKEADSAPSQSMRSFSRTVRVDISKLDHLMDIVGDLSLAKGEISRISEDLLGHGLAQAKDLEKSCHILERRLLALQTAVMDVRMVPVRQLFDKLNRIIRRMAQELGKKVQLEIRGGDTELDKLIVEELADPLMHIIRNALDHGIETGPERESAGKSEVGTITLSASPRGNHVAVEVRDDGRGIDTENLRKAGIERGLIKADAQMTEQDLYGLLFQSGFSTRDEVSEFSGRGVGMDVVKNNISALSGMIDLESRVGEGTLLTLTLPVTLAIIKALVIRSCGRDFAIPLTSVLETIILDPGMTQTIEGRQVLELRQSTLPLLHLNQIFQMESTESAGPNQFVVVAGFADKRVGIIVDDLYDQQDVVIKSLGKALSFVRGISGAADMGNQRTILVLDVGGLIEGALRGGVMADV
ncbi:MAG TPA: chemotaxis protein CheA [Geopsychrobacteraceae bacterium]|nr:chemotaxis protein CheA [Geopsychrobacteraceae bacterium]